MGRHGYGRWSLRFVVALFGVLAAGLLIEAATTIFERPATYRALADHGVPLLATVHCGHNSCTVVYTFAGRRHRNRYDDDLGQFCRCADPTPVLVDPGHAGTMFTVRDVRRGTNAGLGVLAVFSIVMGLLFGGMAVFALVMLRRTPAEPPPLEAPADAGPLGRALFAILQVQELLDDARPLPGYTWFQVDQAELAAGLDTVRRRLAEIPGPRAQALHLAEQVAREVEAAPRIPVIGGVRVRAGELSAQLDQVLLAVLPTPQTAGR